MQAVSLVVRMIPVIAVQHVAKRRDWGSGFLLGIVPPPPRAQQDALKGTKFNANCKHSHPEGFWFFLRVRVTSLWQSTLRRLATALNLTTGSLILHVLSFL